VEIPLLRCNHQVYCGDHHKLSLPCSEPTESSSHYLLSVGCNIIIYLFTAIELLPGGSGYFTCKQNMKLVTTRFKSGGGGLHGKHVVATWNLGNHLSIWL